VLLALALLIDAAPTEAQGRRRRDEGRKEEKKPKRRRAHVEAFSSPRDEMESEEQGLPAAQVDVITLGKAAYDAVIRSGLYVVGPGDMFNVVVNTEDGPEAEDVMVGAEGVLVIPYVGAVPVAGLNLSRAQQAIQDSIQRRFRYLEISVTLSRLRSFPVSVLGEVRWPGTYTVGGAQQVSELILEAGGLLREPEGSASLRNIQIQRLSESGVPEQTGQRADLALWGLTGKVADNPFLLDGDQVFVPAVGDSINISGAVRWPGNYEYARGDRVADLVTLGGGISVDTEAARAELLRLPRDGRERQRIRVDLARALAGDPANNIAIEAGDKLHVDGEDRWVSVEGEVRWPGAYPLEEGLTLRELIDQAGGFTSRASLGQASVIRPILAEGGVEDEEDRELERLLRLAQAQLTAEERAFLSMRTQQVQWRLPVDFRALFEGGEEVHNIVLKGGDIVKVPRLRPTILVSGYVITPGSIPYDSTYTVGDYVAQAGGFGARAQKGDVVVIKASTGNWVKASRVKRIDPGDTILVPGKIPGERWRIFRETLIVLTQVATLIIMIRSLTN
jgi:protein involved in polysaccharide export with SLBB domain